MYCTHYYAYAACLMAVVEGEHVFFLFSFFFFLHGYPDPFVYFMHLNGDPVVWGGRILMKVTWMNRLRVVVYRKTTNCKLLIHSLQTKRKEDAFNRIFFGFSLFSVLGFICASTKQFNHFNLIDFKFYFKLKIALLTTLIIKYQLNFFIFRKKLKRVIN